MPCSACGGAKKTSGRGKTAGMSLGFRGCGSYYYFRRRRVAGRGR
jgi:hypothetical protein|uniref:Uncharacterized protein n=1 Tax=viral metagenome TaxID=1070528 RepID=A0A6C0C0G6_9ZZZZ